MVDGLQVTVAEKEKFHQAIWAGCERVSVRFGDHPDKLDTGFTELAASDATLSRERSQFRIAKVAGKVVQEKVRENLAVEAYIWVSLLLQVVHVIHSLPKCVHVLTSLNFSLC